MTITTKTSSDAIFPPYKRAQTFKPSRSAFIPMVEIYADRFIYEHPGKLIVEIRDTKADGSPGDNVLASASLTGSQVPTMGGTNQAVWLDFDVEPDPLVTGGQLYAIVVYSDAGSGSNYYIWEYPYAKCNPYPNGEYWNFGGTSWSRIVSGCGVGQNDAPFKVYLSGRPVTYEWTVNYRAKITRNETYFAIDISVYKSSGTLRETLASKVALSQKVFETYTQVSGIHPFGYYAVVDQTDHLVVRLYVLIARGTSVKVDFEIDNQAMPASTQPHIEGT